MTAPSLQNAGQRARAARPELAPLRAVVLEQIRATGLSLRGAAVIAAVVVALLTIWTTLQSVSGGGEMSLNAWPTQLPGVIGALMPGLVWARDERFGPSFLWTLPVDRRWHAFTKVFAGWVWLMGCIALFVLWMLALALASGGRVLPPETLHVLSSQIITFGPIDPAALQAVRWVPSPLIWAVPFTAATACYLLASALVLGSRYPVRWVMGAVILYALSSAAGDAAKSQLGAGWLADAPGSLKRLLLDGQFGLDALLTARIESLGRLATLTTGEHRMVWSGVPDLADWRTATLLWMGAGLLALWAATSRHRERRRA